MKSLSIILSLVLLISVSSCKKDENTTPAKSKKEIITAKTWIVGEVLVSQATVYTKGGTDAANIGFAKVLLNFKSDGSITGSDNNGKALPTSAKWAFSSDETKLNLANTGIPGLDGDLLIIQLTEANFEVKGKVTLTTPIAGTFDGNIKMVPQ